VQAGEGLFGLPPHPAIVGGAADVALTAELHAKADHDVLCREDYIYVYIFIQINTLIQI
jgi:hypothetical protein